MRKCYFLFALLCASIWSCGPDLNPQKYLVKSILSSSYEEYSFQYLGGRVQNVTGTDSIRLDYVYYKDSTSIKLFNKSGKLVLRTQLAYAGSALVKVRIKWLFSQVWYKDSISFSYNGNNLAGISYKNVNYLAVMQDGNLSSIRRGIGALSASYTLSYDQRTNPFKSTYWLESFITPNGFTTTLQPKAIARYFSNNNISTGSSVILGVTEIERYSYTYLHGILPKAINVEIETSKNKISNIVYIFDIQYIPKEGAGS